MELNNKVAIVTGASNGLGKAIAQALIGAGCSHVFGLARNERALNACQEVMGNSFIPVVMDVTDRTGIHEWISRTFNSEFYPDILINNAGVGEFEKLDKMSPERWDAMLNINLTGVYNITAPILFLMKQHASSSYILNIGSILGTTTRSEGSAYCATKYAISGFSDALFKEVRGDNIKVTCLNPGSIETDFFHSSGIKAHDNMLHPDELAETVLYLLRTPDNMLINELTVRPLNPRNPKG